MRFGVARVDSESFNVGMVFLATGDGETLVFLGSKLSCPSAVGYWDRGDYVGGFPYVILSARLRAVF
jgi:hypothetical protein